MTSPMMNVPFVTDRRKRVEYSSDMDCTKCATKGCRDGAPCTDRSARYASGYDQAEVSAYTGAASALVDNGGAGTLNRLEEIVEYCRIRGYSKLGVAYCYGMEKEAVALRGCLSKAGFALEMVSCTVDGIKESRLDPTKTNDSVSCNPLGQAHALNRADVPLTLLMGLCLGHDILIQKHLEMDFSTFVVKDRVLGHNPILALAGA